MGTFQSTEEARSYFEGDRYAMITGVHLEELTDRFALASLPLSDIHRNANGGIMGGVIFTLADFVFAVLSNHLHRKVPFHSICYRVDNCFSVQPCKLLDYLDVIDVVFHQLA